MILYGCFYYKLNVSVVIIVWHNHFIVLWRMISIIWELCNVRTTLASAGLSGGIERAE